MRTVAGLCRIRWLAYSGPDDPHSIRTSPSARPQPDGTGVFTDRLLPVSLLPGIPGLVCTDGQSEALFAVLS